MVVFFTILLLTPMKPKKLVVIVMITNLLSSYAQEPEIVDIYDTNFKNYLLQSFLNLNQDNEIDINEAKTFVNLDLSYQNIKSLYGIEEFSNLENLDISGNHVKILDLSRNQKLQTLRCDHNKLVYLEITQNQKLKFLSCHDNKLHLLKFPPNLKYIKASNNYLTYVDISKIPGLTFIHIGNNRLLSLKLSGNKNLSEVSCNNNSINELNISTNKKLTYLDCSHNRVKSLDIRKNNKLKFLNCESNELRSLKINYTGFGSSSLQSLNATKNRDLLKIQTNDLNQARIALTRRDLLIDGHTKFVKYREDLNLPLTNSESKILFSISKDIMKYETESTINRLDVEILDNYGRKVIDKTELIKGQIKNLHKSLNNRQYLIRIYYHNKLIRRLIMVSDYLNYQLIEIK